MEVATWVIAIFTFILAITTIAYARISYLVYKASKEQTEALRELSAAIREAPVIASSLEHKKELQKKIAEERAKIPTPQQKALGKK